MKKFFARRFKIYSVIMIVPLILVLLVSGVIFLKEENQELYNYQVTTNGETFFGSLVIVKD